MREQSVENVMAVLPDAFGDDERRVRVKLAKDLHAHLLRIDEAVAPGLVERMRADDGPALGLERLDEDGFHRGLGGPAFLVGRSAKVAIGHEVNVTRLEWCWSLHVSCGEVSDTRRLEKNFYGDRPGELSVRILRPSC